MTEADAGDRAHDEDDGSNEEPDDERDGSPDRGVTASSSAR